MSQRQRRRIEAQAIRDATFARRSAAATAGWQTRRAKAGQPVDERTRAIGWLGDLRDAAAEVFPCSLDVTEAEVGARAPWLVVGKLTFVDQISYAELGAVLGRWESDVILEASIHPQRVSQIRVMYDDPNDKRGTGSSTLVKLGAWAFVVSELRFELIGSAEGNALDIDEDALSTRYKDTTTQTMYVYFSSEIVAWRSVFGVRQTMAGATPNRK